MATQNFDIVHFQTLKDGELFVIDGETFKKYSDLVYTDTIGIEHYIDALFDKKVGKMVAAKAGAAALTAPVPQVNTSAKVEKVDEFDMPATAAVPTSAVWVQPPLSDDDVERIARRVKELLKEN